MGEIWRETYTQQHSSFTLLYVYMIKIIVNKCNVSLSQFIVGVCKHPQNQQINFVLVPLWLHHSFQDSSYEEVAVSVSVIFPTPTMDPEEIFVL